jgi:50S ribosomal subunit-associated GTPase HflX
VLAGKPELVLLNKCDQIEDAVRDDLLASLTRGTGREVMAASGMTGDGVDAVMEHVWSVARPPTKTGWKA